MIARPSGVCLIRFNSINLFKTLLSADPNRPDAIASRYRRSSAESPREMLSTRVLVSSSNRAPPNLGGRYYSGCGSGGIFGIVASVSAFAWPVRKLPLAFALSSSQWETAMLSLLQPRYQDMRLIRERNTQAHCQSGARKPPFTR